MFTNSILSQRWSVMLCIQAGRPQQIIDIGYTSKQPDEFHKYLKDISSRYQPHTYSLLSHNCNNFADECCLWLCNNPIPSYITSLPEDAFSTPMGQMFKPMIQQMENNMKQSGQSLAPVTGDNPLSLPDIDINKLKADKYIPVQISTTQTTISKTGHSISSNKTAPVSTTVSSTNHTHYHVDTVDNVTGKLTELDIDHPHSKLTLKVIKNNSKPMTSSDNKAATFVTLIKSNNNKTEIPTEYKLNDNDKQTLQSSITTFNIQSLTILDRCILNWPSTSIFPVYGLLRIFVLYDSAKQYYENKGIDYIKQLINRHCSDNVKLPMAGKVMLLCFIANLFNSHKLSHMLSLDDEIRQLLQTELTTSTDQAVQVMCATVLYNISLTLPHDDSDAVIESLSFLSHNVNDIKDKQTLYRVLLSIGHIMYGNVSAVLLLQSLEFDVDSFKQRVTDNTEIDDKINIIADDIKTLLNSST